MRRGVEVISRRKFREKIEKSDRCHRGGGVREEEEWTIFKVDIFGYASEVCGVRKPTG